MYYLSACRPREPLQSYVADAAALATRVAAKPVAGPAANAFRQRASTLALGRSATGPLDAVRGALPFAGYNNTNKSSSVSHAALGAGLRLASDGNGGTPFGSPRPATTYGDDAGRRANPRRPLHSSHVAAHRDRMHRAARSVGAAASVGASMTAEPLAAQRRAEAALDAAAAVRRRQGLCKPVRCGLCDALFPGALPTGVCQRSVLDLRMRWAAATEAATAEAALHAARSHSQGAHPSSRPPPSVAVAATTGRAAADAAAHAAAVAAGGVAGPSPTSALWRGTAKPIGARRLRGFAPSQLYAPVRVCRFCAQFFGVFLGEEFDDPRAVPGATERAAFHVVLGLPVSSHAVGRGAVSLDPCAPAVAAGVSGSAFVFDEDRVSLASSSRASSGAGSEAARHREATTAGRAAGAVPVPPLPPSAAPQPPAPSGDYDSDFDSVVASTPRDAAPPAGRFAQPLPSARSLRSARSNATQSTAATRKSSSSSSVASSRRRRSASVSSSTSDGPSPAAAAPAAAKPAPSAAKSTHKAPPVRPRPTSAGATADRRPLRVTALGRTDAAAALPGAPNRLTMLRSAAVAAVLDAQALYEPAPLPAPTAATASPNASAAASPAHRRPPAGAAVADRAWREAPRALSPWEDIRSMMAKHRIRLTLALAERRMNERGAQRRAAAAAAFRAPVSAVVGGAPSLPPRRPGSAPAVRAAAAAGSNRSTVGVPRLTPAAPLWPHDPWVDAAAAPHSDAAVAGNGSPDRHARSEGAAAPSKPMPVPVTARCVGPVHTLVVVGGAHPDHPPLPHATVALATGTFAAFCQNVLRSAPPVVVAPKAGATASAAAAAIARFARRARRARAWVVVAYVGPAIRAPMTNASGAATFDVWLPAHGRDNAAAANARTPTNENVAGGDSDADSDADADDRAAAEALLAAMSAADGALPLVTGLLGGCLRGLQGIVILDTGAPLPLSLADAAVANAVTTTSAATVGAAPHPTADSLFVVLAPARRCPHGSVLDGFMRNYAGARAALVACAKGSLREGDDDGEAVDEAAFGDGHSAGSDVGDLRRAGDLQCIPALPHGRSGERVAAGLLTFDDDRCAAGLAFGPISDTTGTAGAVASPFLGTAPLAVPALSLRGATAVLLAPAAAANATSGGVVGLAVLLGDAVVPAARWPGLSSALRSRVPSAHRVNIVCSLLGVALVAVGAGAGDAASFAAAVQRREVCALAGVPVTRVGVLRDVSGIDAEDGRRQAGLGDDGLALLLSPAAMTHGVVFDLINAGVAL